MYPHFLFKNWFKLDHFLCYSATQTCPTLWDPMADKPLGAHVKIPGPSKSDHLSLPMLPGARGISHVSWVSRWCRGKESACHFRRLRRPGVYPWVGQSPGVGNGNPLQYSCLENSMGRRDWWATGLGVTKSQTVLSIHALGCLWTVSKERLQIITKWKHTIRKSSANI